jgi:DNA-binding NtrC family response regulator
MMLLAGREALLGESEAIRDLRSLIERVARTSLSVLISGKTGSGKELVAQALHRGSRRDGALVAINVCAVTDSMFEAALFGHVRGAFTGAVGNSPGFLAEANGGTLFLDEISGLPAPAQAKLLRAVETKEFRPVGARMDRRSDFRVVAATNEELRGLAAAGRFRADLLQRLSAVTIRVPALRARADDIPQLVTHFAAGCSAGATPATFSRTAIERLQAHHWPGNVRELRHIVECAIALAESSSIGVREVESLLGGGAGESMLARRDDHLRDELMCALEAAEWDVDAVARQLGVHRATIYRRLKRVSPDMRSASAPRLPSAPEASRLQLEA